MANVLAGVDIGGTKCAVCLGELDDTQKGSRKPPRILAKERFPTPSSPALAMKKIIAALEAILGLSGRPQLQAIGVSCGGPLDSRRGLILSPPNLPGWDHIDVLSPLRGHFGVPAALENDANAGALAEWRWGAGRACRNMIFLTFGTGMGAGLILDGRLYTGTNDLAGEVGHIRLESDGPVGYGKAGSFEGFCSGSGIAGLARAMAVERIRAGAPPAFCRTEEELATVTAETVSLAAQQGDPLAVEVLRIVTEKLGEGLSILVDVLNPERIVIGSIYARQRALMETLMMERLRQEALTLSMQVCEVVPAELGESVGDLAGLSVAIEALNQSSQE
jgi:glucokinase